VKLTRAFRLGLCLVLVALASCGIKGEPVAPDPPASAAG
jgi:predicted small lipoprotein YifL